ncbi:MAG: TraR/DksA family transcriptional regulator [Acidimicrobiales bacterium]
MATKFTTPVTSHPAPKKAAPKVEARAKVGKGAAEPAPEANAKVPAKEAAKSHKAAPAAKKAAPATKTGKKTARSGDRTAFLAAQRQLLLDERAHYLRSAQVLQDEADSLALEHEPGDIQFDEEGGEGGTANVDRELDLVLSAQARAAAVEIDRALAKIDAGTGTYGTCEQCGNRIPDARLQALPQAALCVACKSGGLSSRR